MLFRSLRTFTVLDEWTEACVHLRLEGVEPTFRVWCNGCYIGYHAYSLTPAEFGVTESIHSRENLLAVEVYHLASESWLEDQDFWRFWGIFLSVRLLCIPCIRIEDICRRNHPEDEPIAAQMGSPAARIVRMCLGRAVP